MPRKNKPPRKLFLQIKFKKLNGQPTAEEVSTLRNLLIESIMNGTYAYPDNWRVDIFWRNRDNVPDRSGEFTQEMIASRVSSPGWDMMVLRYLNGK